MASPTFFAWEVDTMQDDNQATFQVVLSNDFNCTDSTGGGSKMKSAILTALVVVTMLSIFFTTSAFAASSSSGWTVLGGDPLFPGGLAKIAQTQGISMRQAFVYAMTSSRGKTAMTYAGLNPAQRFDVAMDAREGNFTSCRLRVGMKFADMSYGVNGESVDQNVTFADPRYVGAGAGAFCENVTVDGYVIHILVPFKCVNFGVLNVTVAPVVSKITPLPLPKITPKITPSPSKSVVVPALAPKVVCPTGTTPVKKNGMIVKCLAKVIASSPVKTSYTCTKPTTSINGLGVALTATAVAVPTMPVLTTTYHWGDGVVTSTNNHVYTTGGTKNGLVYVKFHNGYLKGCSFSVNVTAPAPTPAPTSTCSNGQATGVGSQADCPTQIAAPSATVAGTQTGTTSGQGSPAINISNTNIVQPVVQTTVGQNQGQTQTTATTPAPTTTTTTTSTPPPAAPILNWVNTSELQVLAGEFQIQVCVQVSPITTTQAIVFSTALSTSEVSTTFAGSGAGVWCTTYTSPDSNVALTDKITASIVGTNVSISQPVSVTASSGGF